MLDVLNYPRPKIKVLRCTEITAETTKPAVCPNGVRRYRTVTTNKIGKASADVRAEMAALYLRNELTPKPNMALTTRLFLTYPKKVKAALRALEASNLQPETLLDRDWRLATPADRETFIGANAVALVRANPTALLAALDLVTTP